MKPYIEKANYKIFNMSCLDFMDNLKENSIDAIITDPPYEINFMNKGWDNTGVAFDANTWKKALRVLKPGGYLLAFNHSRTFHRMMVAIEDSGFQIRDTIMWLYGSGFPKSYNIANGIEGKILNGSANKKDFKKLDGEKGIVSLGFNKTNAKDGFRPNNYNGLETTLKAKLTTDEAKKWQGWGTGLKPAFEPIVMAQKPREGTYVQNVSTYGVGGLNIDDCRIETDELKSQKSGDTSYMGGLRNDNTNGGHECIPNEKGRFPANIIHDGSAEATKDFPNTKQGGSIKNTAKEDGGMFGFGERQNFTSYEDEGSASRYFYCAKASKKDREEGLDTFESKLFAQSDGAINAIKKGEKEYIQENHLGINKIKTRKNIHPTVKPTDLMQYLVRLVSPPGSTVLDIFMGSGSTGKAVMFENRENNKNYQFIGVDLEKEYCEISEARIDYALNKYEYDLKRKSEKKEKKESQMTLFDEGG